MRKIIAGSALVCALIITGCNTDKSNSKESTGAPGGAFVGGVLRVNEVNNIKSLMPIAINEVSSYHLASQVYEGLVKYNQSDLTILPALARSWDISPDFKEYTFHIRSNVKFHKDACFKDSLGRFVVASDVKYCFENLCSKNINNS